MVVIFSGYELKKGLYMLIFTQNQERPNHGDSTASRLLSEVKHHRAWLVLRWGTTLESWVLFFSFVILFFKRGAVCPLLESVFLIHLFPHLLNSL